MTDRGLDAAEAFRALHVCTVLRISPSRYAQLTPEQQWLLDAALDGTESP
ncbi:hypothetical protein [Streptomyces sp. CBMA152]|nr:hypothetical protein [Streptomyces sp. CBMA152]